MNHGSTLQMRELFAVEKGRIGIRAATAGDFPLVTTGEKHLSHNEAHFSGDAVCIPLVSATGHGHASINRLHHISGQFAVGSILCACINRSPSRILARYIYYYLTACKDSVLIPLMQGSANVTLKLSDIETLPIPLPPLAEQQAIVARLDALADKVRQLEEHLDAIERDAEALRLSLHHKLSAGRMVKLGDLIELNEDSVAVRPENEYPQVGVRGFGGGLFAKPPIAGTDTSYKAFNRLYVDAVVLSQVKGWEGALDVCPSHLAGMYVSPEYRTFRCRPSEANPAYVAELIKTPWFWSLLQDATRGVGARRERTRPEQFLNIELPMPLLADQNKAIEVLSRQAELKCRHIAIREVNRALVPAMLERVFEGELN